MGNVTAPKAGLGSNSNYILHSNGAPLLNLEVAIVLTQEMISNIGFSFQLNAYSPAGDNSAWQQYVLRLNTADGSPGGGPSTISGTIEPWPASTAGLGKHTTTGDLMNQHFRFDSLADAVLAANYQLRMLLGNDPAGNVRYVTFLVIDPEGNAHITTPPTVDILTLQLDGSTKDANSKDIAPILAFQLNLVGPINSRQSYLMTGAGTITYSATAPLTVASAVPSTLKVDTNWITLETTNSVYSELPSEPSTSITQLFWAQDPGAYSAEGRFAAALSPEVARTNVFAIDRAGQLVVFWANGGSAWESTTGLGALALANRKAAIAAAPQPGVFGQLDIFVVDQGGQLNVFWLDNAGNCIGPIPIGPDGNTSSGAAVAAWEQPGAANQLDVFLVDKNGQLNVFWVVGAGAWNGPTVVGPAKNAHKGAAVAVLPQLGAANQLDVFLVDAAGQLNVFWVVGEGAWNGPHKIGAAGAAPSGAPLAVSPQFGAANQTDVFLVDNKGQLTMYSVTGEGSWQGPVAIGPVGNAPAGAAVAASLQFGTFDQTDVFLVDNNGQLNVFWVVGAGGWNGPAKLGPAGMAAPGAAVAAVPQAGVTDQTDVFVVDTQGDLQVFSVVGTGPWTGPKPL